MRKLQIISYVNSKNIAKTVFKIIFLLSAINALFLVIGKGFGLNVLNSYFFSGDPFADFFKLILSLPGGEKIGANESSLGC